MVQAIAAENSLDYDYAIDCWERVLQRNSNFDAAYVGIGNALYRSADYAEALEYYEKAYDTTNWSESYKMVRKDWMSVWLLPVVALIILLIVLVVKFLGWAAKVKSGDITSLTDELPDKRASSGGPKFNRNATANNTFGIGQVLLVQYVTYEYGKLSSLPASGVRNTGFIYVKSISPVPTSASSLPKTSTITMDVYWSKPMN